MYPRKQPHKHHPDSLCVLRVLKLSGVTDCGSFHLPTVLSSVKSTMAFGNSVASCCLICDQPATITFLGGVWRGEGWRCLLQHTSVMYTTALHSFNETWLQWCVCRPYSVSAVWSLAGVTLSQTPAATQQQQTTNRQCSFSYIQFQTWTRFVIQTPKPNLHSTT